MSDMTRAEAIEILESELKIIDSTIIERKYIKDRNDCLSITDGVYDKSEISQALKIAINSLQIDEQYDLAMEQAEPTGWIPVSERLPETNNDVLVCDGVDMFVAWYQINGMWQGWNSTDNNFERNTPVVAWMPLPEPYKAESEDKE